MAALETELQSKVRSLNEHQSKVDRMEEELLEMAEKQKQMLNLEVDSENESVKLGHDV